MDVTILQLLVLVLVLRLQPDDFLDRGFDTLWVEVRTLNPLAADIQVSRAISVVANVALVVRGHMHLVEDAPSLHMALNQVLHLFHPVWTTEVGTNPMKMSPSTAREDAPRDAQLETH